VVQLLVAEQPVELLLEFEQLHVEELQLLRQTVVQLRVAEQPVELLLEF
jgi:hypothetical protein